MKSIITVLFLMLCCFAHAETDECAGALEALESKFAYQKWTLLSQMSEEKNADLTSFHHDSDHFFFKFLNAIETAPFDLFDKEDSLDRLEERVHYLRQSDAIQTDKDLFLYRRAIELHPQLESELLYRAIAQVLYVRNIKTKERIEKYLSEFRNLRQEEKKVLVDEIVEMLFFMLDERYELDDEKSLKKGAKKFRYKDPEAFKAFLTNWEEQKETDFREAALVVLAKLQRGDHGFSEKVSTFRRRWYHFFLWTYSVPKVSMPKNVVPLNDIIYEKKFAFDTKQLMKLLRKSSTSVQEYFLSRQYMWFSPTQLDLVRQDEYIWKNASTALRQSIDTRVSDFKDWKKVNKEIADVRDRISQIDFILKEGINTKPTISYADIENDIKAANDLKKDDRKLDIFKRLLSSHGKTLSDEDLGIFFVSLIEISAGFRLGQSSIELFRAIAHVMKQRPLPGDLIEKVAWKIGFQRHYHLNIESKTLGTEAAKVADEIQRESPRYAQWFKAERSHLLSTLPSLEAEREDMRVWLGIPKTDLPL